MRKLLRARSVFLLVVCIVVGVEIEHRFQIRDQLTESRLPCFQETRTWAGQVKLTVQEVVASWIDAVVKPSTSTHRTVLAGRVVKVLDGDSLELSVDGTTHVIRLDQIDAPEIGQPWGSRARQALHRQVMGQQVTAEIAGVDRYERLLATILLNGQNINREMVRSGNAWAYQQYLTDSRFLDDEAIARSAQMGLWRRADPVAPWDWRRRSSS